TGGDAFGRRRVLLVPTSVRHGRTPASGRHTSEGAIMSERRCVLVAEDDADIRASIRFLLEEEAREYTVAEAADGTEALAYLRQTVQPCVVLLDLIMPHLSGIEVLRAVASQTDLLARFAFVIVTAQLATLAPVDKELLARLDIAHVQKPFRVDELLAAVRPAATELQQRIS